jgi:hypothetical protein
MNWGLKLHINPFCLEQTRQEQTEQTSPLVFAKPEEAQQFAHRMFEPPLSVIGWELESTKLPVNFKYGKEAKV